MAHKFANMDSVPILGFSGPNTFLSNFATCEICDGEFIYPSVEHAYQAKKSSDSAVRRMFQKGTPGQAKRLGRTITLRPYWETVKIPVMLELLREKFSQPEFRRKLLATGDSYLEETNSWGDTFWGVFANEGQNHLGNLLMQIRDELQRDVL